MTRPRSSVLAYSRLRASELAAISRIASVRDLSVAFIRASQLGVRTPLSICVAQDPQRSDVYAVIVTQAGLGMPDRGAGDEARGTV